MLDVTMMINEANKVGMEAPSRRKKMSFRDFSTIGADFIDFKSCKFKGVSGYLYIMESLLDEEQVAFIKHFKNTAISVCAYRYAPEIKQSVVFIGNKCL